MSKSDVRAWQNILSAIGQGPTPIVRSACESTTETIKTVLSAPIVDDLCRLYDALGPKLTARHHILTGLARNSTAHSLKQLVRRLVDDPPEGPSASAPLIPLFQLEKIELIESVFPDLLESLSNPEMAPAVLDVANYITRQNRTEQHPATSRTEPLIRLAEAVLSRLEKAQEAPESDDDPKQRQQQIAQSVPLAISLCDTLGQIGDRRAIPTLERMLDLRHRRLRVEAAAALIRLGNDEAIETLASLASEPSMRLRVLAYAEELGCADRVAEEHQSPLALAEAGMVAFLSEPTQMGIPPQTCELIDSRTLAWPGFEEPRDCYLFRYSYGPFQQFDNEQKSATFSNIGIAGPLVHTFHADLAELPIEDIYAAFAGWQAEHEEIREAPWTDEAAASLVQADVISQLKSAFDTFEPLSIGSFFGDQVLIARATRGNVEGTAVVDAARIDWYQSTGRLRPLGPGEAFCIYKGRRLLSIFN